MKVLIVKLSAIGDVVHTIPFLRTLKLNFPHWEIDWVLEDVTYPLLRGNPLLRRVIELKRRSWVKGRDLKGFPGFLKALREVNYDLVIDLQGLLKSGIITFLSRGEQKIGLSISKELSYLFYRKVIEVDIERHALIRTLDVAKALGARLLSKDASIFLEPMERRVYEGLLSSMGLRQKEYVVINPVAKWDTKLWIPERFSGLAERIRGELGFKVVFTGSKADQGYIRRILSLTRDNHIDLSGRTTLREMAYLLENARAMVCTDTGPMHMASAMGCPVVALFGPTSPTRTGPFGPRDRVVRANINCSPCFKKDCQEWICMRSIGIEKVMAQLRELLS